MPINNKAKTQMIVLALINILAMNDYLKTALTSIFYNSKHFYWWTPKSKIILKISTSYVSWMWDNRIIFLPFSPPIYLYDAFKIYMMMKFFKFNSNII